jgi:response regulator RpfG family c-di-GMP phosphodiesterase
MDDEGTPCEQFEQCQARQKELEDMKQEFIDGITVIEATIWKIASIYEERAKEAGQHCERLAAENEQLRRTIEALRNPH